jgi:flagellar protein FliO/FliZ
MPTLPLMASLLLLALPVGAAPTTTAAPELFNASYIFQVIGSLLLVFGCIAGLLFLLRKVNGMSGSVVAPLKVLGSVRVGAREKVVLLQVGEQQLLVGVAAGGVNTLYVLSEPVITQQNSAQFPALLAGLMKQDRNS